MNFALRSASNRSGERVTEEAPLRPGPLPVLSTLPAVACRLHHLQNRRHTMMTDDNLTPRVIGGVDTHKDVHVAAVLDELGRLLATATFATTTVGYRDLYRWLCRHGEILAVGVEGTGSWGGGLSRYLRARGGNGIEVNRTNRQTP